MRKGQEQALEGNHCRTQDSGLSSFPRETAQKPGHLEIQSWPRTQGAWLCFCPKLCVPGPRRWRVGTLEHAWCGGCPVASAGSGGSHGGHGGVPQGGMLRLLPGSWQLSGISLRWVLPRSSPDTSHQLFPLPPGLFLGPPGSSAPPVPSPGGGPAGEDSHVLTTALRPSSLPGAQPGVTRKACGGPGVTAHSPPPLRVG